MNHILFFKFARPPYLGNSNKLSSSIPNKYNIKETIQKTKYEKFKGRKNNNNWNNQYLYLVMLS